MWLDSPNRIARSPAIVDFAPNLSQSQMHFLSQDTPHHLLVPVLVALTASVLSPRSMVLHKISPKPYKSIQNPCKTTVGPLHPHPQANGSMNPQVKSLKIVLPLNVSVPVLSARRQRDAIRGYQKMWQHCVDKF